MSDLVWIFVSALLINNFVLAYFLGLCPFLGVSSRVETAFRLLEHGPDGGATPRVT